MSLFVLLGFDRSMVLRRVETMQGKTRAEVVERLDEVFGDHGDHESGEWDAAYVLTRGEAQRIARALAKKGSK